MTRRTLGRSLAGLCLLGAITLVAAPSLAQHGEEAPSGEAAGGYRTEGETYGAEEPAGEGEGHEAAAHEGAGHEAAGEGHHAAHFGERGPHDPPPFVANIVNFVLLCGILYFLGRKPLAKFLGERRREIEEGLAEAGRIKSEAETKHRDYQERLRHLDRELADLKKEIVAAGEKERDRIVADAEVTAARMRRETEFLVEQEFKQLRIDLRREIVEEAVQAAERVLHDRVTADDQRRLADEYARMADRMLARAPAPAGSRSAS